MKIKLCLHEGTARLHIHSSKSKPKLKNIVNQNKTAHKEKSQANSYFCQSDLLTENTKPAVKQHRSKSKKSCDHKKKSSFEEKGDYDYYRFGHRTLEQIQKENEKLRKENKVLNEYFVYFQKKLSKQPNAPSQRLVSFRNEDSSRGRQLFGEFSKQTALTSCKSSSKVHRFAH